MSTPADQIPVDAPATEAPAPQAAPVQMPEDVPTLQNILRSAVAKLMAHSQTVRELLNANMDLRAALHLAHTDKSELEATLHALMHPDPVAAPAEQAPAPEAPATEAPVANADPVSA